MGEGCEGDTVGGPRAVVIHFRDTSADISKRSATLRIDVKDIPPALLAMMSPRRLHSFAFPAPPLPLLQNHILAIILVTT